MNGGNKMYKKKLRTMTSKDIILNSLRENTIEIGGHPDLESFKGITYDDKPSIFAKILKVVGGECIDYPKDKSLSQIVKELYPYTKRVVTLLDLDDMQGIEVYKADDKSEPREMDGTDLVIVESPLGVCENASCLIEQTERLRTHFFISEAMLIILNRKNLVNNMHEAYKKVRERNSDVPFYCFVSGPSKTADIEQALVMGAHGPREVKVLLK